MHVSKADNMQTVTEKETRKENKCENMGEYNHKLMLKLINKETNEQNKATAMQWDEALFASGCKISTRANKLIALYHLIKWSKKQDLKELGQQDLINYKKYLSIKTFERKPGQPQKYKQSTINQNLATIKGFYGWLDKKDVMTWFTLKRQTSGRLKAEEILSQQEILAMVTAAGNKRDKAMIACLWESGCRAGEFLNLKIGDLNFEENTISFTVDGKTGQRQCFLVSSVPNLVEWFEEHPQKNNKDAWLWYKGTHRNGARLTNSSLRHLVVKTAETAGITKPAFSHALRHSRATFAAKQHLNEMAMRQMFGWSKTSTMPSVYITLSGEDTKNAAMQLAGKTTAKKEEPIQPKICVRCGTVATIDGKICKNCFMPLSQQAAKEQQDQQKNQLKALINSILDLREGKN